MPLLAAPETVYEPRPRNSTSSVKPATEGLKIVSLPAASSSRAPRASLKPTAGGDSGFDLPFHVPKGAASCCYTLTRKTRAGVDEVPAVTSEDWHLSFGGEADQKGAVGHGGSGKAFGHLTLSRVPSPSDGSSSPVGVQLTGIPQLPAIKYGSIVATTVEIPEAGAAGADAAAAAGGKGGAKGGAAGKAAAAAPAGKGGKGAAAAGAPDASAAAAPSSSGPAVGPLPPSYSSPVRFLHYGGINADGSLSDDLYVITVDPLSAASLPGARVRGADLEGLVRERKQFFAEAVEREKEKEKERNAAAAAAASSAAAAPAPAKGKAAAAAPAGAAAAAESLSSSASSSALAAAEQAPPVFCTRLVPTTAPASAPPSSPIPAVPCLRADGPVPGPRAFASLALNPAGTRLALFGGIVPATNATTGATSHAGPQHQHPQYKLANDLWILDLTCWQWTRVCGYGQGMAPAPRAAAGLLFVSALPPPAPSAPASSSSSTLASASASTSSLAPPTARGGSISVVGDEELLPAARLSPSLVDVRSHVVIPGVLEGAFETPAGGGAPTGEGAQPAAAPPSDGSGASAAAATASAMATAVEAVIVFGGFCCSTLPVSQQPQQQPSQQGKQPGGGQHAAAPTPLMSRGQSFDSTGLPAPAASVSALSMASSGAGAGSGSGSSPAVAVSPWDGRVYAVSFDQSLINAALPTVPKAGDTSPYSAAEMATGGASGAATPAPAAAAPKAAAKGAAKGSIDATAAVGAGGPSIPGLWGFFHMLQKRHLELEPGHFEFAKVQPAGSAATAGSAPAGASDGATARSGQATPAAVSSASSSTAGSISPLLEASELPSLRRAFFTSLGGSSNNNPSCGHGAYGLLPTDNDGCSSIVVGAALGDPSAAPHASPSSRSSVPLPAELLAAYSFSASALGVSTPPLVAMLPSTSLDFVPPAVLQSRAQQEAGARKADLTQGEADGLGGRIVSRGMPRNRVRRVYKGGASSSAASGGYEGEVDALTNAREGQGRMSFTAGSAATAGTGACPVTSLAGCEYVGGWSRDAFGGGKGVLRMPGGAVYEGPFEAGLPHGKQLHGRMEWPEGYLPAPAPVAAAPRRSFGSSFGSSEEAEAASSSDVDSAAEDQHGDVDGIEDVVAAALAALDPNDQDAVLAAEALPLVNFSVPPRRAAHKARQQPPAAPAPSKGFFSARSQEHAHAQTQEEETLPDGTLRPQPLPKPVTVASWCWARYEGPWHKGCPHGSGATIVFANGAVYSGEVSEGRISGKGRLTATITASSARSGSSPAFSAACAAASPQTPLHLTMDGTWVDNGLLEGPQCTIAITVAASPSASAAADDADHHEGKPLLSEKFSGGFERGIRSGQGTHYALDGSYFSGEYHNGRRNGWGVARSGPYVYEGRFLADVRAGKGSQVYPDGSCYVGSWADNKPHGEGSRRYPDGTEEKGVWRRGRLLPASAASDAKL